MENDINNLDPNDEGLKGIFGDRFHDETQATKPAPKPVPQPREATWEPVPHKPTHMEKLKSCAKSTMLFGGLSLLFFYWQQTGQMAITASMPCICACCVMVGLGVGRSVV